MAVKEQVKYLRFIELTDPSSPFQAKKFERAREIYHRNFPESADYWEQIVSKVGERAKLAEQCTLLVAVSSKEGMVGLAFYDYFDDLQAGHLEFIATKRYIRSRGVGSHLYEALREDLVARGARELYMEVRTDEPARDLEPEELKLRRATMRFYEKQGARPLFGFVYDTPPYDAPHLEPPLLVCDPLERRETLPKERVQTVVDAVLIRYHGLSLNHTRLRELLESVPEPVGFRPWRYFQGWPEAA